MDPMTSSEKYKDFLKFSDNIRSRRTYWNTETLPTAMLERVARYRPDAAKKIFELACIRPLHVELKSRELEVLLSQEGQKWIEHATDRFVQEPGWAMGIIEGVLVLEMVEPQAETTIKQWLGSDMTLEKFRQKPLTDEVAHWARNIYADAYTMAHGSLSSYVQVRAFYIAMVITACLDGGPLTDEGIQQASAHRPVEDEVYGGERIDRQASLPIISAQVQFLVESLLGAPCIRF